MPAWRYPFLWGAAGIVIGVALAELPWYLALGVMVGLTGGAVYAWFKLGWGRLVWSVPLFAGLGWGRAWIENKASSPNLRPLMGQLVGVAGYLIEEPARTSRAYRLLIEADSVYSYRLHRALPATGCILLYTRDSSVIHLPAGYGIRAVCRLDSIRFGQAYWARQKVFLSGYAEQIEKTEINTGYWQGYIQRLRQLLINKMDSTAPATHAPLAVTKALLLGYKRGIDSEVREAFQLSGTAHILAVSGMHVGLVLSLWLFLLRKLPPAWSYHWLSQGFLLVLLVFYGFLTGGSPSAMRAVLMGSVAILARMQRQPYLSLNALGFAAFLQVAADPTVIYHWGFQFSYAAVGGIMAFYLPIRLYLLRYPQRENTLLAYFKDLIAISMAAQMGTFFLNWAYFGRFPLYFLLANLIAIPLATALAFTAVGWLILMYIPILGKLAAYPVYALAWLLVEAVSFLSALPGGTLTLPPLPSYMAMPFTLFGIGIGGSWLHRHLQAQKTMWIV
ncbi:MAG: ComEC family competence protein [Bacteroidia bacterium]|nr:ComEC family competence protein [Bacteroidia bacterium]